MSRSAASAAGSSVDQYSQTSAPQGTFCLPGTGRQPVSAGAQRRDRRALHGGGHQRHHRQRPGRRHDQRQRPAGLLAAFGPARPAPRPVERALSTARPISASKAGRAGGMHNILVVGALPHLGGLYDRDRQLPRNAAGAAGAAAAGEHLQPDRRLYRPDQLSRDRAARAADSSNQAIYAFDTFEIGPMFELNAGIRYEWAKATFQATSRSAPIRRARRALDRAAARCRRRATRSSSPTASAPSSSRRRAPRSTSPTAMPARRPRRRCGSAAARSPRRARPIPAPPRPRPRAITRSAPRRICSAAGCRSPPPCSATSAAISAWPRTIRSQPDAAGGRRPLAGRRAGARRHRATSRPHGRSSPITPISTARCCRASPISASPIRASPASTAPANSRSRSAATALIQTPRHSGSLFTTYRLPFGLQIGYGLTYQGSFATHQRTLLQRTQYFAPTIS